MAETTKSVHPNALPNYQNAMIPDDKIHEYALNPTHNEGKHKARVFKRVLGFEQSSWQLLAQRILAELPYNEAVEGKESQWGKPYVVDLPIAGVNGNIAKIQTVWLFKRGTNYPSLITLWVLPRRE